VKSVAKNPRLKNILRKSAQRLLGFNRYLFLFSLFNIYRIKIFKGEKAFRFFMGMLPAEGAILDIGANIGINTIILAQNFPLATIHAFEPIDENYQILKMIEKIYKVKNVHTYKTALGETNGEAEMVMPVHKGSKMQGWSRVNETSHLEGSRYIVPMQRLDDIDEIRNIPISAIKIDVENFEYFVLKGGVELIAKNKPLIFCELWNDERKDLCFELLRGLGYKVMLFRDDKLVPYGGEDVLDYFFVAV
jgi:FkbM family methyltransferase